MAKYRIISLILLLSAVGLSFFIYNTETAESRFRFHFGLDLRGGSHLVYQADTSGLGRDEIRESMNALREVVERRINIFGVSEPVVQIERSGVVGGEEERLIIELPGVTDLEEAIQLIGKTPLLEFKLMREGVGEVFDPEDLTSEEMFIETGLTGRFLERARLEFDNITGEPLVLISFNREGRELFSDITKNNIGRVLAIFLDEQPISLPVVREEIKDGRAQISGNFTPTEARELVRDLNFGALPLPIELISTQSIGASLGETILVNGVRAGITGFLLVVVFLIAWYRFAGLLAALALAIYILLMLALFKLIPVTLTAAGIAGFVLSVGMAVDANILIFERMKEELRKNKSLSESINDGFKRAWLSIRDSNISSLITAVILFWVGTSLVKGFALTFGIGVLMSMISAVVLTRTFLLSFADLKTTERFKSFFSAN